MTGDIYFDPAASEVIRIEVSEHGPPGYRLKDGGWEIDYAPVTLSGRELFLPVRGSIQGAYGNLLYRNGIQYKGYRKYGTDSLIRFSDEQ